MACLRALLCVGLIACAAPTPDGVWTGQCSTQPHGVRVKLTVTQDAELDSWFASAMVHRVDHVDETLSLTCATVRSDGDGLAVDGCTGQWTFEEVTVERDFSVDGVVASEDPTDRIVGTCTAEGATGALELWRTY